MIPALLVRGRKGRAAHCGVSWVLPARDCLGNSRMSRDHRPVASWVRRYWSLGRLRGRWISQANSLVRGARAYSNIRRGGVS